MTQGREGQKMCVSRDLLRENFQLLVQHTPIVDYACKAELRERKKREKKESATHTELIGRASRQRSEVQQKLNLKEGNTTVSKAANSTKKKMYKVSAMCLCKILLK